MSSQIIGQMPEPEVKMNCTKKVIKLTLSRILVEAEVM